MRAGFVVGGTPNARLDKAWDHWRKGNDAISRGALGEAIPHWRACYALAPNDATMQYAFAISLLGEKQFAEAKPFLTRAVRAAYALDPQAWFHLGACCRGLGDWKGAARYYQQALALKPTHVAAMIGRGFCLQMHGDIAAAESLFAAALVLPCESASDRHEQSTLAAWWGDYSRWAQFENRWRIGLFAPTPTYQAMLGHRRWNGKPFPGIVLLWSEQGFGDLFQLVRYAPLMAARCDHLVIAVPLPAVPLIQRMGYETVPLRTDQVPFHHAHTPMMSAQWIMGTDAPDKAPPPADFRIERTAEPGKAALCWAGGPGASLDLDRSSARGCFTPLFDIPGVRWHSAQKGQREQEYALPSAVGDTWLATAEQLATLEFLVSVDTSTAHLAGSLGVPTYLIPPTHVEWRWTRGRTDSPWYPTTHRLYRRRSTRDWPNVVAQIRGDILARGSKAA